MLVISRKNVCSKKRVHDGHLSIITMMLCTMIILQRKFFEPPFYEIWNGNEGYFFGRRRFMPYSLAAVCAKPSSLHFMFFAGLSKNSWQMMLTSPDLSWAQEKKERREGFFTQKYKITIFCQNNNAQSVSKKVKLPWPVHSPNITTKEDERKCYNNATIFASQKACSEERSLPMKNTGDALQLCSFGRCRINVAATSHFFLALLTWIMTGVLVMDVWLCE